MEKIEITSLSSRGQVVIPQMVREKMHLQEGERFIVIGEDDTILLKKLEVPLFKGFDKLLKKTREFAQKREIKISDVEEAIQEARKK